jgi:hypothetical protein
MKMFKTSKIKFFLVAATLIASVSFANAESPAPEDGQRSDGKTAEYEASGDPNSHIALPGGGDSVVDNALEPVPVSCHDCEIAARSGTSRGPLFEPRGSSGAASKAEGIEAKQ